MDDKLRTNTELNAAFGGRGVVADGLEPHGRFTFTITDRDGNVLWDEVQENIIVTVGKGQILTSSLAGSAYTAVEYMGLIGGASAPTLAAADTMTVHAGWTECGGGVLPSYTAPRPNATYGPTTSGTIATGNCVFVFTGTGTIQGGFIVGGTGAVSTIANTGGVLIAEGALSAAQPVIATNTLTMTHTITM